MKCHSVSKHSSDHSRWPNISPSVGAALGGTKPRCLFPQGAEVRVFDLDGRAVVYSTGRKLEPRRVRSRLFRENAWGLVSFDSETPRNSN